MNKKVKNTLILGIATLISVQSNHIMPMSFGRFARTGVSWSCKGVNGFLTVMPVLGSFFDSGALEIQEEKKRDLESNAPEKVITFIEAEARNRGIKQPIRCIKSGNFHDYSTFNESYILQIPDREAQELSDLLDKKSEHSLTLDDQRKLDGHVAAIHHELTHIQRQSNKLKCRFPALAACGVQATAMGLNRILPFLQPQSFILKNALTLGGGVLKVATTFQLMTLYGQYDEIKADDGIPNEIGLLRSQEESFRVRHSNLKAWLNPIEKTKAFSKKKVKELYKKQYPQWLNNQLTGYNLFTLKMLGLKTFDKYPVLYGLFSLNSTHPEDIWRANRFAKRIAELEKKK